MIEDSNDYLKEFTNVVLVDSSLDEIRCVKLTYWKEDFEGRLDSSGIVSVEVSNEEECDVTKHVDGCECENFSLDEGCKVSKVFLGKKKSNEEEDESIFSGSFEEEVQWES